VIVRSKPQGSGHAARNLLSATLIAGGLAWSLGFIVIADRASLLATDLRNSYLPAASAVVRGTSPFLTDLQWDELLRHDVPSADFFYPYPPLTAELLTPLLLLPGRAAGIVGGLVCLMAILGALLIVGVRDLRCLALAALSAPVAFAVQNGNMSALITLFAALAWRYRHWGPVGVAVALKLFVWPLVLWLAFVRGTRAALTAMVVAAGLTLASWAVIGFDGLLSYPTTLRRLREHVGDETYSLWALPLPGSVLLAIGITFVCVVGCWRAVRSRDEEAAFTLALAASLAATPIVWSHYFPLLLLALAIRRPTLTPAWFIPLSLWLLPGTNEPAELHRVVATAVVGGLFAWLALGAPVFRRTRVTEPFAPSLTSDHLEAHVDA
jgi:hypothetical protein